MIAPFVKFTDPRCSCFGWGDFESEGYVARELADHLASTYRNVLEAG